MRRLLIAAACVAAAIAVAGARASTAPAATTAKAAAAADTGAVFVQTNGVAGNSIVSYRRAADGSLAVAGTFATGGLGAVQSGAAVDTLASQGSLAYDAADQLLFAVNAGSDTLSVFSVDEAKLTLEQVVSSGGSFPSSVAVHGKLVYVLNAANDGSVQGFRIQSDGLHAIRDSGRSLGLGNGNPPFFLTSPGQVGFSPDGTKLIVTTKGSTNSIDVFSVGINGTLSASPVVNPSATPAPFAFTFDGNDRLVSAEAGSSTLSTYTLNADGTLANAQSLADGQSALCWVTAAGGFFYVANAGSDSISGYTIDGGGTPALIGSTGVVGQTEKGAIDMAASPDGRFLYAESGGAGTVDVFALNADGTLTKLAIVGGLPAGIEGIAAS